MKRPFYAWTIFGICLSAMLAGVAWLTVAAWRAEQDRQQALLESELRNALWRLDSLAAPLLAIELNRPTYSVPMTGTPLLAKKLIRGYVVRDASGNWSIRHDARSTACEPLPADSPFRSAHWNQLLDSPDLLTIADEGAGPGQMDIDPAGSPLIEWPVTPVYVNTGNYRAALGTQRGSGRMQANAEPSLNRVVQEFQQLATQNNATPSTPASTRVGPLIPLWVGRELVLARMFPTPTLGTAPTIEICWLEWPEWSTLLETELANSRIPMKLVPDTADGLTTQETPASGWRMITLPIRLELSPQAVPASWPWPLLSACGILVIVLLGFGWLMRQTLSLSERRAAFVSAVTHELRTPLTTFRLYTEMLADGLAADAEQQQTYFRTLHREANRLTHLVENVLAYARLEHGRSTARNETVTVGELFDRCLPRLEQRMAETPLTLCLEMSPESRTALLTTNSLAVEQILFNLIDNSCKYARDSADPRILCSVRTVESQRLSIEIADFGPGFSGSARRTLYQPFRKSAAQAADSAPGIGLGLSLSQRLVRDLRGSLDYTPNSPTGVRFEIQLPLDV
jgi:signal transduction histidine kinase